MLSPVRGVGTFPLTAMALAMGIWGLSGWSAMAQDDSVGGGADAAIGGAQTGSGTGPVGPAGPRGTSGVSAGGPVGQDTMADYGHGGPVYSVPGVRSGPYGPPSGAAGYRGVVYGGHAPGYGAFGPGYPGYGLDYVHGCVLGYHRRHNSGEPSVRNWCSYVLGRECLYPYVADPYTDPAALGFWPPYSAPVASAFAPETAR
jgi:hypothetical protein